MTYDKLGRMITRVATEGMSSWTYDTAVKGIGKLASMQSPAGDSEAYTYDPFGRATSVTTTIGGEAFTVSTTYDSASRVETVTYPQTGYKVKNVYDAYGDLFQVLDATGTPSLLWQAASLDAHNRVEHEQFGNGLEGFRTYDHETGDLTSIRTTGPSGDVQNLTYSFDAIGNLTSRADGVMAITETFGYDNLNRLTSVQGPANKTYTYDTIGNLKSKSDVGTYTYPATGSPRPHAVTKTTGTKNATYTYDANGNRLTGDGRTLTYTSFNKPASVKNASSQTSYFTYDANQNRIRKATPTQTTLYIGKLYEKSITNGTTIEHKHYVYAGGIFVAVYTQKTGTSPTTRYMHTDHLGSVNVVTNETGALVERLSFDTHGKRRNANGTDATTITAQTTTRGYTNHEHDDEVGLINMNARLYDPVLGRFTAPDTLIQFASSSQGLNRYSYVGNNPLSATDPSGHLLGSVTNAVKRLKKSVSKLTSKTLEKVGGIKYVGGLANIGLLTNVSFGAGYGWSTGNWKAVGQAHAAGAVISATYWAGGASASQFNAELLCATSIDGTVVSAAGVYIAESAAIGYASSYSMARIYGASAHDARNAGIDGATKSMRNALMRFGFEFMRADTNASSLESGNTLTDPRNGELFTYGPRPTVFAENGQLGWDRSLLAAFNMKDEVDGESNWFWGDDFLRNFYNKVSKVHDFGNRWAYVDGMYMSYGVAYDTAFNVYSIATMVPSALYMTVSHDPGILNTNRYITR